MPGRSVRWPNFVALAANAVCAMAAGASNATAMIIMILIVERAFHARRTFTARTPVLFRAPTGLAVGLARKESRYGHPPIAHASVLADSPPGQAAPVARSIPLVPPFPDRLAARDSAMGVRR